jgi:transposase
MAKTIARRQANDKRNAEFVRLHDLGLSYSQIAALHGTTRSAVAGAIRRYTKPDAVFDYYRYGASLRRETKAKRIRRGMAILEKANPRTDRDRKIISLYADGASTYEIAAEIGYSHEYVRRTIIRCCGDQTYREIMAA